MFKITQDKIAQFVKITDASVEVAVAYLEAEEGLLDDAIRSYVGDRDFDNEAEEIGDVQDCYSDGENVDPLDTYYD